MISDITLLENRQRDLMRVLSAHIHNNNEIAFGEAKKSLFTVDRWLSELYLKKGIYSADKWLRLLDPSVAPIFNFYAGENPQKNTITPIKGEWTGTEPGERCNRGESAGNYSTLCEGIIAEHRSESGCSCHINPPCSHCVDSIERMYCPACGWNGNDNN